MLYPKYFKEKKDGIKRKTFLRNLEGWMFESLPARRCIQDSNGKGYYGE